MLVELKNIRKAFGGVPALDGVDLAIEKGGLHGLLGENGAGKTTLMNILYGYYRMDSGEIFFDGQKAGIQSPYDAIMHGIGMVHQLSTLVPEFTAAENIILGTIDACRSNLVLPFVLSLSKHEQPTLRQAQGERKCEKQVIQTLCDELGLSFPLNTKIKGLSAGIKQKIEIVRALYRGAKLIIMDEPTTFLVESEFEQLLKSVKKLIEQGITVIFITHKIREVMKACDTVTVLRKGKVEGTIGRSEMEREKLVKMMFIEKDISITESALPNVELPSAPRSGAPFLSLHGLSTAAGKKGVGVHKISFDLYGGEIMGIASVSGNGVKELVAALIAPSHIKEGDVLINCKGISKCHTSPLGERLGEGEPSRVINSACVTPPHPGPLPKGRGGITQGESIRGLSTLQVFERGVFFTPEERINEGVLTEGTIKENILLGHHDEKRFLRHKFFIDWDEAGRAARKVIKEYAIQTPDEETPVKRLSGGNIQKVIIGRAFVDPISLLITHNPTVGLDISSVEFIFRKLVEMRNRGDAVLWANDDLDELMMLCDRIAVIYRGELKGIFERKQFDKYQIGLAMIGACCTS